LAELEGQGFIATASCTEMRVPQDEERQMEYALTQRRQQFRVAAENPRKVKVVAGAGSRTPHLDYW